MATIIVFDFSSTADEFLQFFGQLHLVAMHTLEQRFARRGQMKSTAAAVFLTKHPAHVSLLLQGSNHLGRVGLGETHSFGDLARRQIGLFREHAQQHGLIDVDAQQPVQLKFKGTYRLVNLSYRTDTLCFHSFHPSSAGLHGPMSAPSVTTGKTARNETEHDKAHAKPRGKEAI